MGSLDTVLGTDSETQVTLSPAEAFAAITLAVTSIDGHLSDEEARCLSSVLLRLKLFRNYTNELMNRLFEKILSILRRDGMNILFNAAKECLNQDLREAAFAVATDLLLSEGMLTDEETNFLNDLYQALGVSREVAIQIVQVILIKNRG
ncbi:MAG: tellurite resistance TerB family protein [Aulosira sp. ZfuVER01]|nr:tellurite resistance TerB family protein [Aulosira sp. ZfuVER01]MDZ8001878.1 tellurite resistance TerB family protein [Aulosira sp. DedVER01a]MDZ8053354.1 tellurite resistance TerB family protein [Aulosira sp. ZfuCHP01]